MACSLLPVFYFFLTVHYAFNAVIQNSNSHLGPLFPINNTNVAVHFKGSNEYEAQLKSEIRNELRNTSDASDVYYNERNISQLCPEIPLNLEGKVQLITEAAGSLKSLRDEFENSNLQIDGRYQPNECRARHMVAVLVPYRDRFEHLIIFLKNIHPFLQKQQLDYTIFIVEQAGDRPFNRGMLFNVGFFEAMKIRPFDCFIFHDVDLLPEDDRNLYTCANQPLHMAVARSKSAYELPHINYFGGVSALSTEHFLLVNGFSNLFWGWGSEDDDLFMRVMKSDLNVSRYSSNIARYTALAHEQQKPNPDRFEKLIESQKRFQTEGLNSIEYKILALQPWKLFTWILVELAVLS